jgi:putative PIN family toxin of toxin-antitoxin system
MKKLRVVVDSNVFISLLIGGAMKGLGPILFSPNVRLVLSTTLVAELLEVGTRGHLRKYFDEPGLREFVQLLQEVGEHHEVATPAPKLCRDPDDDHLLALAKTAKADVLLTGDRDLLILEKHGHTRIMNAKAFAMQYET